MSELTKNEELNNDEQQQQQQQRQSIQNSSSNKSNLDSQKTNGQLNTVQLASSTDQLDGNRVNKNKKKKRNNSSKTNSTEQINENKQRSGDQFIGSQLNDGQVQNHIKSDHHLKIVDENFTSKNKSIEDKQSDSVEVVKSVEKDQSTDQTTDDKQETVVVDSNKENKSDKMNLNNDEQAVDENIKIQIHTPTETMMPVNREGQNQTTITTSVNDADAIDDENSKLLLNNDYDKSNDHDSNVDKQKTTDHQTSNGKQDKQLSKSESKIPELLLTENNLPNNANKLIVCAILLFKFITYFIIKIIELFHPTKRNKLPPINEPLLLLSATEITQRIKNDQLKCEHIVRAYINRIESVQPKLNAMIDNCFEDAINKAKEIDEQLKDPKLATELKKLPLLGVPFTCKDSIAIKGLTWTAGVVIRKGIKAEDDATVIKNLRNAGAIPLGITNTPEFVLWSDTFNNLYGTTNNPYDLSRIVGGSSGGEGCLIAAAGSLFGVGSDVAGSIRIPATFNGVFGHKTTSKYVKIDGMWPPPPETFQTFMCYGPIARYARDLPLLLKAFGGPLTDELRLDETVDLKKIKIYYMEHDGGNPLASFVDQRILNAMHKVIKYFREEYNIETEQININKFKYSLAFFGTVCEKRDMKIEDYITRDGHLNVYLELFKSLFGKSDITRPILIQILNQNSPYCDPNSPSHKKFSEMMKTLRAKVHDLLGDNAVLIMPTWPTIAPKHGTLILRGFDASYTAIMNAMELACTHVPVGLTKEEGMPLGFSIACAPGRDRISIAFAKEIEKQFGGWIPPQSEN